MAEPVPLRILVVDDEPLGRRRVEELLSHEPNVQIVATADTGDRAIEAIRAHRPDLVFLDVQLPGKTGLDVVREVGAANMPATIFVTAYDAHALDAFELAALDYVLKPFDDERFHQAFTRARKRIELDGLGRIRAQLLALLGASEPSSAAGAPAPASQSSSPHFLERIPVELKGRVRFIPVSEIDYITSDGPYAELHTADRRHVIREAMQALEERLDPAHFIRIHRSAIVRLDLVDTLFRGAGGDYEVQLRNGVKLRVSRARREELERRLGIEPVA